MPKVKVYNLSKKGVGEMELSDSVFDATVNESLLYDVLKAQLASHRKGAASSQTRAEVSATGRKLYKQKGTGGARHGSKRAPIFVGGGTVHGPKPRRNTGPSTNRSDSTSVIFSRPINKTIARPC